MFRLAITCVAVLCLPLVHAQPSSCGENAQCSVNYYCEANVCRECLSCQDLQREPPLLFIDCIKSVAECGSCKDGLVDVNAECVPPDASQLAPTPNYVWVLIGIGVLVFLALVVGIIAYILRYPEIFKTAGSAPSSTVTARITATAPEAPPPYNPLPQSPYQSPPYLNLDPTAYNENEQFIKRSPPSRPQDARESAGNQAARVYDKPFYERERRPPSPESAVEYNDAMTPIHDEDTMPSPWTPNGSTGNEDVNANQAGEAEGAGAGASAGGSLPALLAAARDSTLVEHSAPKKLCVRQDSNNNRNRESNSCGDNIQNSFPRSPSPSQGGGPFSFFTQITNVVQINTSK